MWPHKKQGNLGHPVHFALRCTDKYILAIAVRALFLLDDLLSQRPIFSAEGMTYICELSAL